MLPCERFGCDKQGIRALLEKLSKRALQFLEISWAYRPKEDVRMIGGNFRFTDTCRHAWI